MFQMYNSINFTYAYTHKTIITIEITDMFTTHKNLMLLGNFSLSSFPSYHSPSPITNQLPVTID